ncbi:MAG: hypothetical protein AMS17_18940 [Spirochaetes bacterium DG_61]|nr:MAG: hypothetical protein AMS17_18940 [Spirochaetes bacterium DG_61]
MKKQLPSYISTGEPDSFAMNTMKKRKPYIIDQIIEANTCTSHQRDALLSLKQEILEGVITDPFLESVLTPQVLEIDEIKTWKLAIKPYMGKSWLNIPFYFAEAYLYFRILIAFGYFDQGSSFYLKDPFEPFKKRELHAKGGGLETGRLVIGTENSLQNPEEKYKTLIYNALWGNRIDLSMFYIVEQSRHRILASQNEKLLIDHTQRLIELLQKSERIDVILDNVGSELVCDLILARYFLSASTKNTVHFHVKKHPVYVSDVTAKDVDETVDALVSEETWILSIIGQELNNFMKHNRFHIHPHYFWNSALHYPDLPGEILGELRKSDLIILKGDVNYRRLLEDRKWEAWDHMAEIASYFPKPFATLRTMKSEIVVDIEKDRTEKLFHTDPHWLVNGERGIIQVIKRK